MKYTEQDLKDEYEQAVKRRGKLYADGYVEGLKDAQNQALTIPVVRLSLFNEVYDKFVECEDDNEFTQYLNENTNEA